MKKRIALVVDDNGIVLHMMRLYLMRGDFTVLAAKNGRDALAIIEAVREPVTIAIVDIHLPQEDTGTLINQIREKHPEILILLVTGSGPGTDDSTDALIHKYPFLLKPFMLREFLDKVEKVCETPLQYKQTGH